MKHESQQLEFKRQYTEDIRACSRVTTGTSGCAQRVAGHGGSGAESLDSTGHDCEDREWKEDKVHGIRHCG